MPSKTPETRLRLVAIDGPAGSGKSTVAQRVAPRLGLEYLDTGAMYRSVAFACREAGVDPNSSAQVIDLAEAVQLRFEPVNRVIVNGTDASEAIRSDEISAMVSKVAAIPEVRTEMVRRQRAWAVERGGGVMEGRDIGTVVFPDAMLKVYLSANEEVRAQRRAEEAGEADVAKVAASIARRDRMDSSRQASPLKQAGDAIEIDTSYLTIDEVVEAVVITAKEAAAEGPVTS